MNLVNFIHDMSALSFPYLNVCRHCQPWLCMRIASKTACSPVYDGLCGGSWGGLSPKSILTTASALLEIDSKLYPPSKIAIWENGNDSHLIHMNTSNIFLKKGMIMISSSIIYRHTTLPLASPISMLVI